MTALVEHVISADGTRIAFRRLGSGPPLVAIHGGLGSAQSWSAVARRLADRFALLLVDRRGRGDSGPGAEPHAFAREVEDAHAVLEQAGSGAVLLGHSFGGAVALEAARTADVARLAVYEPAVGIAAQIPRDDIDEIRPLVREHPEAAVERGFEVLTKNGLVAASAPVAARPEAFRAALRSLAWTVPRELGSVADLGSDLSRFSDITAPTLVLVGTSSPDAQQRNCEALVEAIPDATLARLEGQGHTAHTGAPDVFVDQLGAFLG